MNFLFRTLLIMITCNSLLFFTGCKNKHDNQNIKTNKLGNTNLPNSIYLHIDNEMMSMIPKYNMNTNSFFIIFDKDQSPYIKKLILEGFNKTELKNRICKTDQVTQTNFNHVLSQVKNCSEKFKTYLQTKRIKNVQSVVGGGKDSHVYLASIVRDIFNVNTGMSSKQAIHFFDKNKMKNKITSYKQKTIKTGKYLLINSKTNLISLKEKVQNTFSDISNLVFKPTSLAGSRGVKIFRENKSLDSFMEQLTSYIGTLSKQDFQGVDYILEEYISGNIYRFDGYVENGKIIYNFVGKELVAPILYYQNNQATITKMKNDKKHDFAGKEYAQNIINALEISNGIFHFEAIKNINDKEFYFLECAARPGGGGLSELLPLLGYSPEDKYFASQVGLKTKNEIQSHDKRYFVFELQAPGNNKGDSLELIKIDHTPLKHLSYYYPTVSYFKPMEKRIKSYTSKENHIPLGHLVFLGSNEEFDNTINEAIDFLDNLKLKFKYKTQNKELQKLKFINRQWVNY